MDGIRKLHPRKYPKYAPPKIAVETQSAFDAGYCGRFPKERSEWYMREWTKGRERFRSEHRDTVTSMVFESSNMENFSRRGRTGK